MFDFVKEEENWFINRSSAHCNGLFPGMSRHSYRCYDDVRISSQPSSGPYDRVKRIIGYCQKFKHATLRYQMMCPDYSNLPDTAYAWDMTPYGNVQEEIPDNSCPPPLSNQLVVTVIVVGFEWVALAQGMTIGFENVAGRSGRKMARVPKDGTCLEDLVRALRLNSTIWVPLMSLLTRSCKKHLYNRLRMLRN